MLALLCFFLRENVSFAFLIFSADFSDILLFQGSSYIDHKELGSSYVKVAQCYMVLGDKRNAIPYFYKGYDSLPLGSTSMLDTS